MSVTVGELPANQSRCVQDSLLKRELRRGNLIPNASVNLFLSDLIRSLGTGILPHKCDNYRVVNVDVRHDDRVGTLLRRVRSGTSSIVFKFAIAVNRRVQRAQKYSRTGSTFN